MAQETLGRKAAPFLLNLKKLKTKANNNLTKQTFKERNESLHSDSTICQVTENWERERESNLQLSKREWVRRAGDAHVRVDHVLSWTRHCRSISERSCRERERFLESNVGCYWEWCRMCVCKEMRRRGKGTNPRLLRAFFTRDTRLKAKCNDCPVTWHASKLWSTGVACSSWII